MGKKKLEDLLKQSISTLPVSRRRAVARVGEKAAPYGSDWLGTPEQQSTWGIKTVSFGSQPPAAASKDIYAAMGNWQNLDVPLERRIKRARYEYVGYLGLEKIKKTKPATSYDPTNPEQIIANLSTRLKAAGFDSPTTVTHRGEELPQEDKWSGGFFSDVWAGVTTGAKAAVEVISTPAQYITGLVSGAVGEVDYSGGVLSDVWNVAKGVKRGATSLVNPVQWFVPPQPGKAVPVAKALRGAVHKEHPTGAGLLEQFGVQNKWAKNIGGLGLDIVLDPLTYIGVGAGTKAASRGQQALGATKNVLGMASTLKTTGEGRKILSSATKIVQAAGRQSDVARDIQRLGKLTKVAAKSGAYGKDVTKVLTGTAKYSTRFSKVASTGKLYQLAKAPTRAAQSAAGQRALITIMGQPLIKGEKIMQYYPSLGKAGSALSQAFSETPGLVKHLKTEIGASGKLAGKSITGDTVQKISNELTSLPYAIEQELSKLTIPRQQYERLALQQMKTAGLSEKTIKSAWDEVLHYAEDPYYRTTSEALKPAQDVLAELGNKYAVHNKYELAQLEEIGANVGELLEQTKTVDLNPKQILKEFSHKGTSVETVYEAKRVSETSFKNLPGTKTAMADVRAIRTQEKPLIQSLKQEQALKTAQQERKVLSQFSGGAISKAELPQNLRAQLRKQTRESLEASPFYVSAKTRAELVPSTEAKFARMAAREKTANITELQKLVKQSEIQAGLAKLSGGKQNVWEDIIRQAPPGYKKAAHQLQEAEQLKDYVKMREELAKAPSYISAKKREVYGSAISGLKHKKGTEEEYTSLLGLVTREKPITVVTEWAEKQIPKGTRPVRYFPRRTIEDTLQTVAGTPVNPKFSKKRVLRESIKEAEERAGKEIYAKSAPVLQAKRDTEQAKALVFNRVLTNIYEATPSSGIVKPIAEGVAEEGYKKVGILPWQVINTEARPYYQDIMQMSQKALPSGRLIKGVNTLTAPWRAAATVWNLGFHARNRMSNWFNMVANYGPGVLNPANRIELHKIKKAAARGGYTKYGAELAQVGDISNVRGTWYRSAAGQQKHVAKGLAKRGETYQITTKLGNKISAEDFLQTMERHGAAEFVGHGAMTLGSREGPIQQAEHFVKGRTGKVTGALQAANPVSQKFAPTQVGRALGKNIEETDKLATALYSLKKTGSMTEAAAGMKKTLFDYYNLSPFEKKYMRTVFPFYTWSRKNIPYQVEMAAKHPGAYAAIPKTYRAMEGVSGIEGKEFTPGYFEDLGAIPTPFKIKGIPQYYNPDLPFQDMLSLRSPAAAVKDVFGMLNPYIKAPLELGFGKEVFTGREIEKGEYAEKVAAPFPFNVAGEALGLEKITNPANPKEQVYGMSPTQGYLARQIPFFGNVTKWMAQPTDTTGQAKQTTDLLSSLAGVKFLPFNLEKEKKSVAWENVKSTQKYISYLENQKDVDIPSTAEAQEILHPTPETRYPDLYQLPSEIAYRQKALKTLGIPLAKQIDIEGTIQTALPNLPSVKMDRMNLYKNWGWSAEWIEEVERMLKQMNKWKKELKAPDYKAIPSGYK